MHRSWARLIVSAVAAPLSLGLAPVTALAAPGHAAPVNPAHRNAVPAFAALGTLTIVPTTYTNPRQGCYNGTIRPLIVINNTNTIVTIYGQPDCAGAVIGRVIPTQTRTFEFGASVKVPS
ncbi:hypothetical protein [Actinomadura roseirufa]|uniref:hypothetical protein n=1 Tax=Actinomadura roseirufa TaxID=2094049 RepID=UPI00104104AC|nr:hypothetical protein [Actinomadura roseirufa]